MRRLIAFCALAILSLSSVGCDKDPSSTTDRSMTVCPIQVSTSLDYAKQVDYKLSGYSLSNYSSMTVCFRRMTQGGYEKTYSEIVDTRENPDTYHTYHTYQRLAYDEVGVKTKWIELTVRQTGEVERYVNYR